MNDKEHKAHEALLRTAHEVLGERIDDSPQGPNDDAQAEYQEEQLIVRARDFVEATQSRDCAIGHRLDRVQGTEPLSRVKSGGGEQ